MRDATFSSDSSATLPLFLSSLPVSGMATLDVSSCPVSLSLEGVKGSENEVEEGNTLRVECAKGRDLAQVV